MKGIKILVVDDEEELTEMVRLVFVNQGAKVNTATSGREALQILYGWHPALVILDLMMPDMDGWEVCKRIRQMTDVPIIMLSALNQEDDIIRGLSAGADDYVTKPFNTELLLARATAVLRRLHTGQLRARKHMYDDGYLSINLLNRQVYVKGEKLKLSATEFKLLEYLFREAGRICTYAKILENVWGNAYNENPEYVHIYIWHLRQKLEQDPRNPSYIVTEHRIGYRFYKMDDS